MLLTTKRNLKMSRTKKILYCGVDLHSNNGVYVVTDKSDKVVFKRRLPNQLSVILPALKPFKNHLAAVAVESTYNWYWLVDGLMDQGYPVILANPAAITQYNGIKDANDLTDAAFLAHLTRLGVLPTGYIYPKEDRPVRDLLRRRTLLVRHRTALKLSLQNMFIRQAALKINWKDILKLTTQQRISILGDDEYLLFVTESQLNLIQILNNNISQFEQKILKHAKLKPEFELLLTIPGVGLILGLTIMLETGTIDRFKKAGNYTSYCRCVRASRTSNGKSKGKNNSKNGNPYLGWAFVEIVHHAIRTCPQARKFYDRKKSKRNGALATKALGAKWSKGAYYVMKKQEPFDLKRMFS